MELAEIYGKENFYFEVHNHGMEQQAKCNEVLVRFAEKMGVKTVAANDVHFLNRDDHEAHDVMICIGIGRLVIVTSLLRFPEHAMRHWRLPSDAMSSFSLIRPRPKNIPNSTPKMARLRTNFSGPSATGVWNSATVRGPRTPS